MEVCNDCEHFDPMTGWCDVRSIELHPLTGACEKYESWEESLRKMMDDHEML